MPDGWSEEELSAAVTAYREMAQQASAGLQINKAKVYEALGKAYGRTAKAFEYRMQNISYVLDSLGQPWLPGLKPAKNVGASVARRLEALLSISDLTSGSEPVRPSYRAKLPAMRGWLIGVARNRSVVRYGDLMRVFEIDRFSLRHALGRLGHQSQAAGEPVLTAVVVNKAHGRCSSGLRAEFGIADDSAERARLYEYWTRERARSRVPDASGAGIDARAARFARVAIRPDQAAFRRAVFIAWSGRCAITGCDIQEALDACHKRGRDWRLGHNGATDGYLLRKDLHALYDRELLEIGMDGVVRLAASAVQHYGELQGRMIQIAPL